MVEETTQEEAVLAAIRRNPKATLRELSDEIGINFTGARSVTNSGVKPRRSGWGYKPRKPGADFIQYLHVDTQRFLIQVRQFGAKYTGG